MALIDEHHPFESEEIAEALNVEWKEKRRLARAIKALTENLVTSSPPPEAITEIANQVEELAARMAQGERFFGRLAWSDAGNYGTYGFVSHEINPLIGHANPVAPPVQMWLDGDTIQAKATLGWTFEGPPGCLHGGVVCSIFDQVLGFAQVLTRQPGVTGTLTTRFIKPTPLHRELRIKAWVTKVDGRKNYLAGEMYAGDLLTASSEGVFIHIDHFRELRKAAE